MSSLSETLLDKINSRDVVVGIIGLGYVGLPLAHALHQGGQRVIGFDVDQSKISALTEGRAYLQHLGEEMVRTLAGSDRFEPTDDFSRLGEADAVLICLPTPLGAHREPDLSYIVRAGEQIGKTLRKGQLIILESTTYPGTTRKELLEAIQQASGGDLTPGEDYFVAFSPEREDPGSATHSTTTIPKLVGGLDEVSGKLAVALYTGAVEQVVEVSSAEIAESAKLLENIFRGVNIAMANEMKVILDSLGIDVWEVIEAASTKPFGFMPFYPGPGLGGHCIPVDPFYLSWKARETGHTARFIELAGEVNQAMPLYVVDRLAEALNGDMKAVRGSRVLVIGVAYKPNVDDMRETPAAEIIDLLAERGADIVYHDPFVPTFPPMRKHDIDMNSTELTIETVKNADAVLVVTDHTKLDWDMIATEAGLVVDTRNAMRKHATKPCSGRLVHA